MSLPSLSTVSGRSVPFLGSATRVSLWPLQVRRTAYIYTYREVHHVALRPCVFCHSHHRCGGRFWRDRRRCSGDCKDPVFYFPGYIRRYLDYGFDAQVTPVDRNGYSALGAQNEVTRTN